MAVFGNQVFGSAVLRAAWVAMLLLLGAVAVPAGAQSQQGAGERIEAIAARLRSANVDRCAEAVAHCGGRMVLSEANHLNAWADGRTVSVTAKMMRFAAEDDALAFVIAHEMAHNLLGHAERLRGISPHFTDDDTMARIRATEIEADILAVELVAAAGFDTAAAERLLQRLGKHRHARMPASYPSIAQRIALVRTEVVALAQVERIAASPDHNHAMRGGTSAAVR